MMNLSLIGKRAVVTGASLGIGAAVVKMLSEYGAEVEYSARNPKVVEDQLGQEKSRVTQPIWVIKDRLKRLSRTCLPLAPSIY